jgi:hypothetical protein
MASIRRGIADGEAGRTVPLDRARDEWISSADTSSRARIFTDLLWPLLGLGLGYAILAHLVNQSNLEKGQTEDSVPVADDAAKAHEVVFR